MSLVNLTGRKYPGNFNLGGNKLGNDKVSMDREIDCSKELEVDSGVTGLAISSSKQYKVFIIPAGSIVFDVTVAVKKVEGAADTIDVGDSDADTTFHSNLSMNALATTKKPASTDVNTGKYYAAEDYILISADAALGTCKFNVVVDIKKAST